MAAPFTPDHFIRSRPLDVHRWADYPELNHCIGSLVAEIETWDQTEGKRKKRRSTGEAKRFRASVSVLCLDAYAAWKSDPGLQIGVHLNANKFSENSRYNRLYLSYRPFKAAFDGLCALGYLQVDKHGYKDRATGVGHITRVRATGKLIGVLVGPGQLDITRIARLPVSETIILRADNKANIEYEDTETTQRMRDNLATINRVLESHCIDLEVTDEEFDKIQWELCAGSDPDKLPIDLSRRSLHRVFNNGSFEASGRFYGGWWQGLPREYRRCVTINGKRTVELDYSGFHARMLYIANGLEPPDDPYEIGLDVRHRDIIKRLFNAMINAGPRGVRTFDDFDPVAIGMSWIDLQTRIKEVHAPIAHCFNSGVGLWLQYMDSRIAEQIMLHFARRGIPCLPVHDSFIVHHGYRDELLEAMQQAFREVIGGEARIQTKPGSPHRRLGSAEPCTTDLMDILAGDALYRGHEDRVQMWFARKSHRAVLPINAFEEDRRAIS